MNRRHFVKQLPPLATIPFWKTSADTILYNANIITVDPKQPKAQAIAILGDRILAVGSNRQIKKYANGFTKKINIGGKTITPGFIDAHSHPASSGRRHLRNVNCDLRSIAAIQEAIKERAAKTPKGEWVSGFLYDDTKTVEGRFINRHDLDAVAPDHPVYIGHRGGHTAYVNSKALALVNYTKETPDPAEYGLRGMVKAVKKKFEKLFIVRKIKNISLTNFQFNISIIRPLRNSASPLCNSA